VTQKTKIGLRIIALGVAAITFPLVAKLLGVVAICSGIGVAYEGRTEAKHD